MSNSSLKIIFKKKTIKKYKKMFAIGHEIQNEIFTVILLVTKYPLFVYLWPVFVAFPVSVKSL